MAAQLKREKLTELTKILEDQLRTAHGNLDDAETALERFRARTITLPQDQAARGGTDTRDPIRNSFFEMQAEREQVRRDREAIERLLAQANGAAAFPTEALSAIESVQHAPELSTALKELSDKRAWRTYRYHYSEAYPPLQHLETEVTALEQRSIPALARDLASQLATRESELGRQVDDASIDLRSIPSRTIEETRLRRSTDLKEQTYTALQQRFDQAGFPATFPAVRILDPAIVPHRPIKNTKPRLLLMGLLAGLALGLVGAVVLDRVDPRVRYPEQISRELGLPILGVVPHLRSKEPAEVVEALRGIRLNVIHEYGPAQPLQVTITSPGPGDGKTFLSANLALAFAGGGHRTLIVDGDASRPAAPPFKINRQPGLVDYLMGRRRPADRAADALSRLQLIGCGLYATRSRSDRRRWVISWRS